jgi:DNA primase
MYGAQSVLDGFPTHSPSTSNKLPLIEWALKRCITLEALESAGIEYDTKLDAVKYPRLNTDFELVGWKIRRLKTGKQHNIPTGIKLKDTLPFIAQRGISRKAIICEGETDALCFASNTKHYQDAYVLGVPGATSFANVWASFLRNANHIYLVPDADEPGEKLVHKICSLLPRTRVVRLDEGEDLTDAVMARGIDELEERFDGAGHIVVRSGLRRSSYEYDGSRIFDKSLLIEVVCKDTHLFRRGQELIGRCPLHEERSPSFMINEGKGVFFCHGCNKGGDVIAYVRERHGFSFAEAVRYLKNTRQ